MKFQILNVALKPFSSEFRVAFLAGLLATGCGPSSNNNSKNTTANTSSSHTKINEPKKEPKQPLANLPVSFPEKSKTPDIAPKVEEKKSKGPPVAFSVQLRKDLTPFHEAIRKTNFLKNVETLKFTEKHYVRHLQEMLLIHEELDKALYPDNKPSKDPKIAALYGDEQHKLINNLRNDIKTLGAQPILEKDAFDTTKELLLFIRNNPNSYEVTGVNYALWGAVANGGGFIAICVDATLKPQSNKTITSYYGGKKSYESFKLYLNDIDDGQAQGKIKFGAKKVYELAGRTNDNPFFAN